MKTFILAFLLVLYGCGGGSVSQPVSQNNPFNMPAAMVKSNGACLSYMVTYSDKPIGPVESTPVIWNNQVVLVTGNSMGGKTLNTFRIDTFDCKTKLGEFTFQAHYMNAFANNGTMYVFGQGASGITMTSSTDLITWTPQVTVLPAPQGMEYFNTSITQDASGFLMAIETKDAAYQQGFITHFARSVDMVSWSLLPQIFVDKNIVTNCPWIWFNPDDNFYYLIYLNLLQDQEVSIISRSPDLVTWSNSTRTNNLVPFTASQWEGNNNSDVALLEYNNTVHAVYARGDQCCWLETVTAIYSGSLSNFVQLFF